MEKLAENILARLKRPIIIIGLMGAGKSHVGVELASALGLAFVDVDKEIEKYEGCSVATIFETRGEEYFRTLERKTLMNLISDDIKVISPGGGAVMNEQTSALIWGKCLSIWLAADLDVLVERTSRNDNRPLLKTGNPRDILSMLMEKRNPVYARADIHVDSNSPHVSTTLDKTLRAMDAHLKEI